MDIMKLLRPFIIVFHIKEIKSFLNQIDRIEKSNVSSPLIFISYKLYEPTDIR